MSGSATADRSPASASSPAQQSSSSSPQHSHQWPEPSSANSPLSSFLAGIAGGSASTVLLYPLDLIKVRMQVNERRCGSVFGGRTDAIAVRATTMAATRSSPTNRPRTICCTVRGVISNEGYLGLYRGLAPAVIGSAASWGGFFILYEEMKRQLLARKQCELVMSNDAAILGGCAGDGYVIATDMQGDDENKNYTNWAKDEKGNKNQQHRQARLGPIEHFSASCLAGACMVALTNPLWLIKTRLQLQNLRLQQQLLQTNSARGAAARSLKPAYRGLFHAAQTIVREEGASALYKGSVPALMLVSHGGLQFVTYEFLKGHFANFTKNRISKDENDRTKTDAGKKGTIAERLRDSLGYLVMGATSKFVASTATYPLQVIKSRLQQRSQAVELSESTGEIVVKRREYFGLADCAGRIWRNEGMNGFFKGCVTNAVRVAPSAAITFVTYELMMDLLAEKI